MSEPIVLGIESTCDETAAAVVQGRTLISNVVASPWTSTPATAA